MDDAIVQKIRIGQFEEDLAKAKAEKEAIQLSYQAKIDVRVQHSRRAKKTSLMIFLIQALNADMAVERETYQKSRSGLDLIYSELQKKYDDECLSKQVNTKELFLVHYKNILQDVETEYQLQLAQKNDFIEATKLMEKDMEIKTTLYNHMKEQIDSIKDENIRLSEKLRVEIYNEFRFFLSDI